MDLHNVRAGIEFLLNNKSPLRTESEYIDLLFNYITTTSIWFSRNNPNGALCLNTSTHIYYSPDPPSLTIDSQEGNDCREGSSQLTISSPLDLNFHSSSDQDWFYFCPVQGTNYNIIISNFGESSITLELSLSNGTILTSTSNISWVSTVTNQFVYLKIMNENSSQNFPAPYTLSKFTKN